jgi:hypothetical protein
LLEAYLDTRLYEHIAGRDLGEFGCVVRLLVGRGQNMESPILRQRPRHAVSGPGKKRFVAHNLTELLGSPVSARLNGRRRIPSPPLRITPQPCFLEFAFLRILLLVRLLILIPEDFLFGLNPVIQFRTGLISVFHIELIGSLSNALLNR